MWAHWRSRLVSKAQLACTPVNDRTVFARPDRMPYAPSLNLWLVVHLALDSAANLRTGDLLDQVEPEIDGRGDPACGDYLALVNHPLVHHFYHPQGAELVEGGAVRCRAAAAEEAGCAKNKGAGADRRLARARGSRAKPVEKRRVARPGTRTWSPWHDD